MAVTVVAIYEGEEQAEEAVNAFEDAGFDKSDVKIITSENQNDVEPALSSWGLDGKTIEPIAIRVSSGEVLVTAQVEHDYGTKAAASLNTEDVKYLKQYANT